MRIESNQSGGLQKKDATEAEGMNDPNVYPPGWNRKRVQRIVDHYEHQTDEDAEAELQWAEESGRVTMVAIPNELLSAVRALIAASR